MKPTHWPTFPWLKSINNELTAHLFVSSFEHDGEGSMAYKILLLVFEISDWYWLHDQLMISHKDEKGDAKAGSLPGWIQILTGLPRKWVFSIQSLGNILDDQCSLGWSVVQWFSLRRDSFYKRSLSAPLRYLSDVKPCRRLFWSETKHSRMARAPAKNSSQLITRLR